MAAILPHDFDEIVNKENMIRGDLYWAFSPALIADRARCTKAWNDFNNAGMSLTRRERLELWNKYVSLGFLHPVDILMAISLATC
jgi:hypothetical protein